MRQSYRIPNRIKNLCTKEFLTVFKNELLKVFDRDLNEYSTYWSDYAYLPNTCGFALSLKNACEKHQYPHMGTGILRYYKKLDWYDSDSFGDELVLLMVEYGIIQEGSREDIQYMYNDWDYYYEYYKDVSGGRAYRRCYI